MVTNTRGSRLVVHHLNGYNWDKEHRLDINNVVVIRENIHKNFHKLYGYGNNTKNQWDDFINKYF